MIAAGAKAVDPRRGAGLDLAGLALLAGLLRAHGLDRQLSSDEIAALLHRFEEPFTVILTQPAAFVSHPLYELLARACLLVFGAEPWAIRLPAAAAGVAGVLVLYLLVRRLAGRLEALLAAGLAAVSYHGVFFSQYARGYTLMLLFHLAATLILLRLPRGLPRNEGVAYGAASALCACSVPFGVFTPAGQACVALPAAALERRRGNGAAPRARSLLALYASIAAAVVALYLPLATHALRFATTMGRKAESGERLSLALVPELLEGLRAGLGGTAVVALAVAIGLVGLVDYARRQPFALGLLAAPVLATALALIGLQVGVHPRYVLTALPLGILVGSRGLAVLARWIARAFTRGGARLPTATGYAALALVVLAGAAPLRRYYELPQQDFLGSLAAVRRLASPGDRVAAAQVAGHVLNGYYRAGFETLESLDDLQRMEHAPGRIWVVTTVERVLQGYAPGLVEHLRERYRLVTVLPGTLGDGQMRIYVGNDAAPISRQRESVRTTVLRVEAHPGEARPALPRKAIPTVAERFRPRGQAAREHGPELLYARRVSRSTPPATSTRTPVRADS